MRRAAELRAAEIIAGICTTGYLYGSPLGVELPGLLVGLAGIGYGLLRIAEPERVPAVLTMGPANAEQVNRRA